MTLVVLMTVRVRVTLILIAFESKGLGSLLQKECDVINNEVWFDGKTQRNSEDHDVIVELTPNVYKNTDLPPNFLKNEEWIKVVCYCFHQNEKLSVGKMVTETSNKGSIKAQELLDVL